MEAEKKLHVQTKLRTAGAPPGEPQKQDEKLAAHMQTREDFSSLTNERDAFRKARMKGLLDFLYKGKVKSTRLKTETEPSYIEKMIARAKKHMETEAGAGGGMEMGMEEPMMESNRKNLSARLLLQVVFGTLKEQNSNHGVKRSDMEKTILQEMDSVLAEVSRRRKLAKKYNCQNPDGTEFRLRRASFKRFKKLRGLRPKQWPHEHSPAFSVKNQDGGEDDIASFNKFYDEVKKNKCAYIALGGARRKPKPHNVRNRRGELKRGHPFDYVYGDQHSDAYAVLNPETRATGKVKITDKTSCEAQGGKWEVEEGGKGSCVRRYTRGPETPGDAPAVAGDAAPDVSTSHPGARRMTFFSDPMAYHIASYEKYSRKGERNRDKIKGALAKLKKIEAEMKSLEVQRKETFGANMSSDERRAKTRSLTARQEALSKQGEALSRKLQQARKAGEVGQAHAASAKDIGKFRAWAKKKFPGIDFNKPGQEDQAREVQDLLLKVTNPGDMGDEERTALTKQLATAGAKLNRSIGGASMSSPYGSGAGVRGVQGRERVADDPLGSREAKVAAAAVARAHKRYKERPEIARRKDRMLSLYKKYLALGGTRHALRQLHGI